MDDQDSPELAEALLNPAAYPHPVSQLQRLETHMSWLFLTGDYVYKVKKPIHFDFVDFSTLERRGHFCHEELRLNTSFAPELYLGVVPVIRTVDGTFRVDPEPALPPDNREDALREEGDVVEWAVKMRQFDISQQADVLVEENRASTAQFNVFGSVLAGQHACLVRSDSPPDLEDAIIGNFETIESLDCCEPWTKRLTALRIATEQELKNQAELLVSRISEGFIRDCHGDLHLSNMVSIDGAMMAFDCLEFAPQLRAIDVWNDIAFLLMDCDLRGRADLAYACIDGYLDAGADYAGTQLLPLYARYRSMVRAKVAALALEQQSSAAAPEARPTDIQLAARQKLEAHISWTERSLQRGPGTLIVTCGLSGSGKSYWAKQLVPALNALRLRTDVYRKQRAGLAPSEHSNSTVAGDLYSAENSEVLYDELATLCEALLTAGETVIVDAACLLKSQRETLLAAGQGLGAGAIVLHLQASEAELRRRIRARNRAANDASEADESVLEWQLAHHELPTAGSQVLTVDTETTQLSELIQAIRDHGK